ncbi:hypothetical protein D3C76_991290 [compost metagenome]
MRYINNNVSFSTIEIRLYQQEGMVDPALINEEKAPLFERANDALKGTINVLTLLVQWIVVILFGALPILLIGGVVWLTIWLVLRRKKGQQGVQHDRYGQKDSFIEITEEQGKPVDQAQESTDDLEK